MAFAPIPLAAQAYELASTAASAQLALNLYAEKLPDGSRSPFILKPSPGLALAFTVGAGPVTAMASIPGYLYVVSGPEFYRITADGVVTLLGNIGPVGTLAPTIALGADQAVVVMPPRAYVASHTAALHEVTTGSGNFPVDGASSVAWLDGYFVFTSFLGDYFFISALLDGATYDSLDFATSERRPDFVTKAIEHNGELWLWGRSFSAVWYNSGAADFPFRERAGSVLRQGLASPASLATLDNSIFWLGSNRMVFRTQGYSAVRVSTHAVEEILARAGDLSQVVGAAWQYDGHSFYALSLADRTLVFDAATGLWHERSSSSGGRWAVNAAALFGTRQVLGSSTVGEIYDLDATLGTEDGVAIPRQAVLPALVTHGPRAFMARLEVEMELGTTGAPASVDLDWSDDGGVTWRAARALAAGDSRSRVVATRLGSFRQRVLRLSGSGRLTVYGVAVDVAPGAA